MLYAKAASSTVNQTQALPVLPLTSNFPPAGWTLLKIPADSVSAVTTAATTDTRSLSRRPHDHALPAGERR